MTKRSLQLVKPAQLPGSRTYRRKDPADKTHPQSSKEKCIRTGCPVEDGSWECRIGASDVIHCLCSNRRSEPPMASRLPFTRRQA
jgi:hypothetical protein